MDNSMYDIQTNCTTNLNTKPDKNKQTTHE